MNRSTFQTTKYMIGYVFLKARYIYECGRFRSTGSHILTTITHKIPSHPAPTPLLPKYNSTKYRVEDDQEESQLLKIDCQWHKKRKSSQILTDSTQTKEKEKNQLPPPQPTKTRNPACEFYRQDQGCPIIV